MARRDLTEPPKIRSYEVTTTPEEEIAPSYDVFDKQNPNSLWSMLPEVMAGYLEMIPHELLDLSEEELKEKLWGRYENPGVMEQRLRLSFWNEFEASQGDSLAGWRGRRKMNITAVFRGICARNHFYNRVCKDPMKLAWVVRPPANYALANEELLMLAQGRSREILGVSPIKRDEDGKVMSVDVKLADIQEKIRVALENRRYGLAPQKIDQRNLHLHGKIGSGAEAVPVVGPPPPPEELDRQIKALQDKLGLPPGYSGPGAGGAILEAEIVPSTPTTHEQKKATDGGEPPSR